MAAPSRVAARQAKAAEALNEQVEETALRVEELKEILNEINAKLDQLLGAATAPKKGANK